MESLIFLGLGVVAAVGAAMAVGTAAALLRYWRTGRFPGQETPDPASRTQLAALIARVVVGAVVAVWAAVSLAGRGIW